tara:strand:- start:135 stop:1142 length:1008 start_codon:yes stop_codon:yes gene_type:complete
VNIIYRWIHRVWYEDAVSGLILLPLSGLYLIIIKIKEFLYRNNFLLSNKVKVPVIVVGNITVGGTGKTPTVVWLANELKDRGYFPGIISRGYGGSHKSNYPIRVAKHSDTSIVGDEPVLLARRLSCPVIVDKNRTRASMMLINDGVNVIISDDGLQHSQLNRDFEICIIDGSRGLGNFRLIPSGPLRDQPSRLMKVDQILVNGANNFKNAMPFKLKALGATRLNGSLSQPLESFKGMTLHAVAGIGNPKRFFELLRSYDVKIIEHSFPDHAVLSVEDLDFGDQHDIFMTEKDAVKFGRNMSDKFWFIPIELFMKTSMSTALLDRIESRLKSFWGK